MLPISKVYSIHCYAPTSTIDTTARPMMIRLLYVVLITVIVAVAILFTVMYLVTLLMLFSSVLCLYVYE